MSYTTFCVQECSVTRARDGSIGTITLRSGSDAFKGCPTPEFRKRTGFEMKMVQEEKDAIICAGDAWVEQHGITLSGDAKEGKLRFYVRAVLRGLIKIDSTSWASSHLGVNSAPVPREAAQQILVLKLQTKRAEAALAASAVTAAQMQSKVMDMQCIYTQLHQQLRVSESLHQQEVSFQQSFTLLCV